MTPNEYDRSEHGRRRAEEIHERYAVAIPAFDVAEGRDFGGCLPYERLRFNAWVKCGGDHLAALNMILDDEEAGRSVGG